MDFEQLEYFLAVVRTKKFSEAAELCFISQSSVSKRIQALERELGVRLLDRSHTETRLTEAGMAFLPFATSVVEAKRDVTRRLSDFRTEVRAPVRLGTLPVLGAYDISSALSEYCAINPEVHIDLFEREQSELVRRLDLDQIDFAIIRSDLLPPGGFDLVDLIVDEIVVVCPAGHWLASRDRVELSELRHEQLVLMDERSTMHHIVVQMFENAGLHPRTVLEQARHELLLSAVAHGIGISLLPRGLACDSRAENVAIVALADPTLTTLSLAKRPRVRLSAAARDLWVHLARLYGGPDAPGHR